VTLTVGTWPEEVIEQAVKRNLVIVVGAGVSASCSNGAGDRPPAWDKLLTDLVSRLGLTDRGDEIADLVDKDRLLDAAELLRQECARLSKMQDLHKAIKVAVDGKASDPFLGSLWHESIVRLDPSTIVTTNYDKIIERATSNAYNQHDFRSTSVAGDVRRGEPTLLKIHGTVDHIESIVLARTDYTRVRLHGAHAMQVLQALFLTRPALLLGYRLRDPDIQLLLENVFGGRGDTPAHFMLTSEAIPDYEREVLKYSYGVSAVTYSGSHEEGLTMLQGLAEVVENSIR
jgi:hypothetical protein